jgi:hypothetical protein
VSTENVCVIIRLWLPDRPGALGLVASRIGALRGDIVSVVVLERCGGVAVDELAVDLPDAGRIPMLVREIQEVDGARVEDLEVRAQVPDTGLGALELAARLVEAGNGSDLQQLLVEGTRQLFGARWAALVNDDWILTAGEWVAPVDVSAEGGVARASLLGLWAMLLVDRPGERFYHRELLQLGFLARVADAAWHLLEREELPALAAGSGL